MLRRLLLALWLLVASASAFVGWRYYVTPLQERVFTDAHALFSPAGVVGHGYGVVGTLLMVSGVGMYSLRKRSTLLAEMGKLATWLQLHIFLCTLGPFLVLLHTSFRFGGLVSIAFWSMTLVVVSGIFGRYLYVRIPKTINGQFLTIHAIEEKKSDLLLTLEREVM